MIKYPCSLQEQTLFNFRGFFFFQYNVGYSTVEFQVFFSNHCKVDHVDSTILFSLCEVDFLFPGFRAIANVVQFQRYVVSSLQCWLFDGSVSVFFSLICFKHCKVDHVEVTILFHFSR